jgi:hypothetical protein
MNPFVAQLLHFWTHFSKNACHRVTFMRIVFFQQKRTVVDNYFKFERSDTVRGCGDGRFLAEMPSRAGASSP